MPISKAKILIIDDDIDVLTAAKLLIKRYAATVDIEKNPQKIPDLVSNGDYDLFLLDMTYTRDTDSGREGFHWLDQILDIQPDAKVIMITAYDDIEMAVHAIKAGASDFVLKPWENEKLIDTLEKALDGPHASSLDELDASKKYSGLADKPLAQNLPTFVANSGDMRQLMQAVDRAADTDASILILGENGTGKTQLAQQIHYRSRRSDKPFVAVDLGSLNENLVESELFGQNRGDFPDAHTNGGGRFEEAEGGTLFLDEIGSLSPMLQAKLLTMIQEQKVAGVEAQKAKGMNFRLICATNIPLEEMVYQKSFRQDLFDKINTISLQIPPLRDRPGDIRSLADFYLNTFARKYNRSVTKIDQGLVQRMMEYGWPGNIRELQHSMERAVILSSGKCLEADTMPLKKHQDPDDMGPDHDEAERGTIKKTMKKYGGNITDTAKELGLSRSALYRLLEKYDI